MTKPQLTFITKEGGCGLCDDAWEEIESAQDYAEFDIEIVKIRKGDALYDKYWDKIPVILINGDEAFLGSTSRDRLLKKLKGKPWWQFW